MTNYGNFYNDLQKYKNKNTNTRKKKKTKQNKEGQYNTNRAFNIFQVCQYFTIYWPGGAFLLKFEKFS
jgi:hypothetical protein